MLPTGNALVKGNANKRDWLKHQYALERQKYFFTFHIFRLWKGKLEYGGQPQSRQCMGNTALNQFRQAAAPDHPLSLAGRVLVPASSSWMRLTRPRMEGDKPWKLSPSELRRQVADVWCTALSDTGNSQRTQSHPGCCTVRQRVALSSGERAGFRQDVRAFKMSNSAVAVQERICTPAGSDSCDTPVAWVVGIRPGWPIGWPWFSMRWPRPPPATPPLRHWGLTKFFFKCDTELRAGFSYTALPKIWLCSLFRNYKHACVFWQHWRYSGTICSMLQIHAHLEPLCK